MLLPEPQSRQEEVLEFADYLRDHYDALYRYLERWSKELSEREAKVSERENKWQ